MTDLVTVKKSHVFKLYFPLVNLPKLFFVFFKFFVHSTSQKVIFSVISFKASVHLKIKNDRKSSETLYLSWEMTVSSPVTVFYIMKTMFLCVIFLQFLCRSFAVLECVHYFVNIHYFSLIWVLLAAKIVVQCAILFSIYCKFPVYISCRKMANEK